MCRGEDAVIAIELAVGEPEAVVGPGVEPTAVIFLGPVAQDRRGRPDIVGDAVNEDEKVVTASVENRLALLKPCVEGFEVADGRTVEGRCRRLGAERA
jgi:hypothetical protein